MFFNLFVPDRTSYKVVVVVILPLIGYGIWATEFLFARPNPIWATALLTWAFCAAGIALWLALSEPNPVFNYLERYAGAIVIALVVVVACILVLVSILQARYFALSVHAEDTAYYNQILWNTLKGNFLIGNVQQERLYNPPVTNDLALHVAPVLFAILPIYAVVPSFLTLLIIRDVALAAAAWPLFLLVRDRINGSAGVAAAVLYLASPVVIAQGCEAFYLLQLAPLPFFAALRAFEQENFLPFLSWLGVALGVREDVAIALAGFGLWALLRKRQLQWVAVGLGLPVFWWGISTLVIQPAFGRVGNSAFDRALQGGGQGPLGSYQILLKDPGWILEGLHEGGLNYLYQSFRSVAFLPALGAEGLLAAPGLVANLFVGRVFYSGSDPISRFALLPSCALIGATVLVVGRLSQKYYPRVRVFPVIMLLLLPSVSLLDGLKDAVQSRLGSYTVRNDAQALREVIALIPETASVAAPNYALPALSKRATLFYVQYMHMYPHSQPDYFLLDRDSDRMPANPELRHRFISLINMLSSSPRYETIWQQGPYFLLRRVDDIS